MCSVCWSLISLLILTLVLLSLHFHCLWRSLVLSIPFCLSEHVFSSIKHQTCKAYRIQDDRMQQLTSSNNNSNRNVSNLFYLSWNHWVSILSWIAQTYRPWECLIACTCCSPGTLPESLSIDHILYISNCQSNNPIVSLKVPLIY